MTVMDGLFLLVGSAYHGMHPQPLTSLCLILTNVLQVMPGVCDRSFGIHVARIAQFPRHVVEEAEGLAISLERGQPLSRHWGEKLEKGSQAVIRAEKYCDDRGDGSGDSCHIGREVGCVILKGSKTSVQYVDNVKLQDLADSVLKRKAPHEECTDLDDLEDRKGRGYDNVSPVEL
ncbi:unnamed protein product [Choristocarpus tenellus]